MEEGTPLDDCKHGFDKVNEDVEVQLESVETCMECASDYRGCPVKAKLIEFAKQYANAKYGLAAYVNAGPLTVLSPEKEQSVDQVGDSYFE